MPTATTAARDATADGHTGPQLHMTELHEVRTINAGLRDLAELSFDIQSLIPEVFSHS